MSPNDRIRGDRSDIATRFTADRPCPVCGAGTKSCSATADGLHLCRGEPGPGWRELSKSPDDAGFRHYRRAGEPKTPRPAAGPKAGAGKDFAALAARYRDGLLGDPRLLALLAADLGVPAEALEHFGVGVDQTHADGGTFTVPERDGAGSVIGVATRYCRAGQPPRKKCVHGSKRGLTVPDGWRDRPGPVYVVEGFSDAAALTAAGLPAVGRPSNAGGAKHLAGLLRDLPPDRDIVVVGENDRKPAGDWPGKEGAEAVARRLTAALKRAVLVALPPADAKDVRAWLTHPDRAGAPWPDRGAALAGLLDAAGATPPDDPPPRRGGPGRTRVVIGVDEFAVNAEAAAALAGSPGLFQRGGLLVTVRHDAGGTPEDARVRRASGVPVVRELPRPLLRERLSECVEWVTLRSVEGELQEFPAHPPEWSVSAVHARGDWPGVRPLEAVVTHPVLLPDGSILAENGYHPATGLLACLPDGLAIDVPDRPTAADAAAAARVLLDPLSDFPFETPAHRAALVAGLLTPLAWFAFDGPAPLFLIDKNVRGAGAGLLADVVALVVTGARFSVMAYTADRDELRKRVTTLAVEGDRLVLLDNLAGPVGNDVLDAALTADIWRDRMLGSNRGFCGPLHVVWFATGNNVQLQADTSRRTCHVRMESADERPELRAGFRHPNLRRHVAASRGRLLSAGLTVLRAYVVAGKPDMGLPPWGSYEGWSELVRGAVVYAGLPDPGATREQLQGLADRDAAAMADILDGLRAMTAGGPGLTAVEIVRRLRGPHPDAAEDAMKAAVEDLCGKLDSNALGVKFRTFKRRNFGGRMLDSVKAGQGKCRWEVVDALARRPDDPHRAHHANHADGRQGGDGGHGYPVPPADAAPRVRRRSAPDDRPGVVR